MTNIKDKLISLTCGIVLGAVGCYWGIGLKGDQKTSNTDMSASTDVLLSTTSVQATTKTSEDDPDVVVSQKYVAVINGEKVSVPVVTKKDTNTNSEPSSSSGAVDSQASSQQAVGVTGTINQTIDLTPLLSKLKPQWELGVGAGYMSNSPVGVLSIQRNYKEDKGLELSVYRTKDNTGFVVQHKWLIK